MEYENRSSRLIKFFVALLIAAVPAKQGDVLLLDRDVIGVINIVLKYLSSDGRAMSSPSTEPHAVRVKLISTHQGLTPLTVPLVSFHYF